MQKIDWGRGVDHLCRITNPEKKNYGQKVRLHKGYGQAFFMDEYETDTPSYTYSVEDFEVLDVEDSEISVKIDNNYWQHFRNETARNALMVIIGKEYNPEYDTCYVEQAVCLADELVKRLKGD